MICLLHIIFASSIYDRAALKSRRVGSIVPTIQQLLRRIEIFHRRRMSQKGKESTKKDERKTEELESNKFGELPLTLKERLKRLDISDYLNRSPDDQRWFDRKYNRKQIGFAPNGPLWAAPTDARYQQIKMGRHCSDYYQDYYRCINLLGENHKPCKFFYNTFTDICPSSWIEKFDEWREEGIYPGHFDR